MRTRLPGRACNASVVSNSATTSRREVSPISINGVPTFTDASLVSGTRNTRPATGERTLNARPPAPPGRDADSAARATSSSCVATCWSATAASVSRCAALSDSRSVSSLVGAMKPSFASCSLRLSSLRACSCATLARSMRVAARSRLACVASMRAPSSRVVRSSSSGASTGVRLATTMSALTASPSRSVMRDRRPASGAETT